jgi:hypothetical protein
MLIKRREWKGEEEEERKGGWEGVRLPVRRLSPIRKEQVEPLKIGRC